jgi:ankyrin repeat protein
MGHGIDGGDLLHIAAWHGNVEIVSLLLSRYRDRLDLEAKDPTHHGTTIGWAMNGSQNSWANPADHAAVIEQLLAAGAKPPRTIDGGSEAVREVLRRHGVKPR